MQDLRHRHLHGADLRHAAHAVDLIHQIGELLTARQPFRGAAFLATVENQLHVELSDWCCGSAGTYSILNRYVFDRREDLPLPTVFLVSGQGEIVKVYREPIVAARILEDIPRIATSAGERLARAVPFAGTFYASPGERNEFQYALELSEQGFDAPAVAVFERVAKLDPTAITLYNLGTLYLKRGNPLGARAAFERALEMQPESAEASNSLGALLAQSGEVPAAIERFRAALQARPDFPDALNNLGFALFQTGQDDLQALLGAQDPTEDPAKGSWRLLRGAPSTPAPTPAPTLVVEAKPPPPAPATPSPQERVTRIVRLSCLGRSGLKRGSSVILPQLRFAIGIFVPYLHPVGLKSFKVGN
jgi:tetratricopeptide (TPR) repeat protein